MIMIKLHKSIFSFLRSAECFHARHLKLSSSLTNYRLENADAEILENTADVSHQSDLHKRIPLTTEEFHSRRILAPCQPLNPHILKVSILGEPNAGKSTLTNSLVKWKVCSVSRKVHTTRKRAVAVLVEHNKQIVFLDTPGFVTPEHSKKHFLEPSFVMDPLKSVRDADLIAVVVDISNRWTNNRISEHILEVLENFKHKKSILILNKMDAMKSKSRLLSMTQILTGGALDGVINADIEQKEHESLPLQETVESNKQMNQVFKSEIYGNNACVTKEKRGWTFFSKVFMVSALTNDGVDDLRNYLLNEAQPGNWAYHDSIITDQHPHEIAIMTVREKLLEYLPEEIPYSLKLTISKWEILSTGCPKIEIKIGCSNSRHKRFVIGPNGKHIAACVEKSRRAMREAFRKDVVLRLGVV